ncbi:sigma factor-like helix-turn-helix DNA-binding protein [Streptomyces sp. NPDC059096]|uniref:sigma factor-like helix-turn-helix DNA-binding protein n=1 Tax=Streptomyces sp. NPDC059096 TaxID=3346727 RepID=UPI0036C1E4C7
MTGEVHEGASFQEGPLTEPALGLPLEFEAFYLSHHELFHAFAEVQFGSRDSAQAVIHEAFREVLGSWDDLLLAGNLEQQAWAIVRKTVEDQMNEEGREPAFVLTGPIAQALREDQRFSDANVDTGLYEGTGLYEAIAQLPQRQFELIVLRYVLKYPAGRVAWYLGLTGPTVDYYIDDAKDRLLHHMDGARRALEAAKTAARNQACEDAVALSVAMRFAREQLAVMRSPGFNTLSQLEARQFEVLVLRRVMGYPVRRIAALLGLHERTVDHHLRKARENYAALFAQHDDKGEDQ